MKHVFRELVPEHKIETFRNYKYQGSDNSILYEYFFSPACDYVVHNFVPAYVAFAHQPEHRRLTRSPSPASSSPSSPT